MRNPGVGFARELMTVPCGRWCVLMHSVVVRDGDRIRTQSYGDTPFTFTPGGRDRYDEGGLRVIKASPPRPRYARDRAEEFRICYPRTVWGGLAAPGFWPAPTSLNPPLRPPPPGPPPVPPTSTPAAEIPAAGMPVAVLAAK